jgi:hypothetical protein
LSEWSQIRARSGNKDVWLAVHADSEPEVWGWPWLMPDGRTSVYDFILDWRPEELPFPIWLTPSNGGRRWGDMLFTRGLSLKVVSTRMIQALEAIDASGYRTFDLDIRDASGATAEGYVGFATDPTPESDIQNIYDQDGQNSVFIAKRRVVEALRQHGASGLDIQPYSPD